MTPFKLAILTSLPGTLAVTETIGTTWTPELIAAVFIGLTGLITSVLNIWLSRKGREALKSDVKEVHTIVNGSNTALMKEIRDLKLELANLSRNEGDRTRATNAIEAFTVKEEIVKGAVKEAK